MPMASGDMSGPGRALSGLGHAISGFGEAMAQADDFETKLKTTQFINQERQNLDQHVFEYKGDPRELPTTWQGGYEQRRQQFVDSLPNGKAKQAAQLSIEHERGSLSLRAINEGQRGIVGRQVALAEDHVTRTFGTITSLDDIKERAAQADLVIGNVPGITESQRQALRRRGAEVLERTIAAKVESGEITPEAAEAFVAGNKKEGAKISDVSATLTSGIAKRRAHGWAADDPRWQAMNQWQKAATMALMEADGRDPDAAKNAAGAMVNRAAKAGEDLGAHVSGAIYQPTMEGSQQARLASIANSPQAKQLAQWIEDRAKGKEPDPVNGATHFLATERTMLALEADNPSKYRSWRQWTGFDGKQYRGVIMRDRSHAFLAPEGVAAAGEGDAALTVTDAVGSRLTRRPEMLTKAIEKARTKRDADLFVQGVVNGTVDYNPHDDTTRKIVDKAFRESGLGARIFAGDPDAQQAFVQVMGNLKRAPDAIAEGIAGLVQSKDPDKIARGYDLILSAQKVAPHAFAGVQGMKEIVEDAEQYRYYANAHGAKKALEVMGEMRSPEFKRLSKSMAEESRKFMKEITEGDFNKKFDDAWLPWNNPSLGSGPHPAKMAAMAQFKERAEYHFAKTGDKEAAKELAASEMRRSYAPSELFGRRNVMPYPPEQIYGSKYKKQMEADLKKEVGTYVPDGDLDTIQLLSDRRTADEVAAGKPVTYRVQVNRKLNGYVVPHIMPGRWPSPDTLKGYAAETAQEFKTKDAELKAKQDAATEAATTGTPRRGKIAPAIRELERSAPTLGDE